MGETDLIYGQQIHPENRVRTYLHDHSGIRHGLRREPLRPRPNQGLTLFATTSGSQPFERLVCRYRIGSLPAVELSFNIISISFDDLIWEYVSHWQVELPGMPFGTLLWYQVAGQIAAGGPWVYADNQARAVSEGTLFAASFDDFDPPAWSRQAVIYHIFVDRFYPGDGISWKPARSVSDFYGGTLAGIRQKLGYIQDLGCNTLWLSPVFESPSHHGYDSTDLFSIAIRFGRRSDLEALISEAHTRGMRVLLDFVPNHWSDRHPTFVDARSNPESAFRDWYLWRSWPDDYECYYHVRSMPKLNLNPGSPARKHLIDAAQYWLQLGVDGFRLDHVEGPVANFWIDFRRACLQANPECWLFGEIVSPPSSLRAYAYDLHGSLDFAMARALRQTFGLGNWQVAHFESFVRSHERYFDANFSRPAFLDNHDMNRFLFLAGGNHNRLKLAALALYSLSGQPVLYYGTETGLSQDLDVADGMGLDEARLPMHWGAQQDPELLAYFRRLGALRARYMPGQSASRRTVALDSDSGLYAYVWDGEGSSFMAVFNLSEVVRRLRVNNPFAGAPGDRLNNQAVEVHASQLEINLAPLSGAWIA